MGRHVRAFLRLVHRRCWARTGDLSVEPTRGGTRAAHAPHWVAIALTATLALAAGAGALGATARAPALPRVTVIGDSVGAVLGDEEPAQRTLARGLDLDLRLAPCRRVGGTSCPFEGTRAQTVIDLARDPAAALGPTVVVVVGYNDDEELYAGHVEEALQALARAGADRVLWATLRAARHPYLTMNDAIVAAAESHPELTVVEWNVHSRSHPEWFWEDGIHPNLAGATALAALIHRELVRLGIAQPPRVELATTGLPEARTGRPYSARLRAQGGRRPYRFSLRTPIRGLALSPSGRLTGTVGEPPGAFTLNVRVRDAAGATASRAYVLRVRPTD